MGHICAATFLLFLVCSFGLAQDSRADLFGGYSYLNIDTNGLTSSRQNGNGWESSISGNFNKWFAAEASVNGYYKAYSVLGANLAVSDYSYAAGPRFNFKPIFIHALLGGDHLSAQALGISESQDGLVGAFGGGIQWRFARQLSLRTSADYVFSRHNILGGPSVTQNNFRASVGLVYSFGTTRSRRTQLGHVTPQATGLLIPSLGVTVATADNGGAEITDEAPSGIATLAGLHSGDVINVLDGKPIKTAMELAAEVSSRAPGSTVRLGYMVRGQWQTQTTATLECR